MFSWSANRVKPKLKATYTRKKRSTSLHSSSDPNNQTPSRIGGTPTSIPNDNSAVDETTGLDSMDVAPPSPVGSSIESEDNSIMLDAAMAANDSAPEAAAADTQLQIEMDKEMSEGEEQLYRVEYFVADDFKKIPGSNIPQKALLTKWVGFDRVDELTWEPESEMRDDVPYYVETYYKTKIVTASSERSSKVVKPTRGRPRKDGNAAPRGRGRPPKNAQAPQESLPKTSRGRGRPPKNAQAPQESSPKSGPGRPGRPRKV